MDRPEDRNATQVFEVFPDGATLAGLEAHIRALRERGAPDDAHPAVKLNDEGEITGMACVVERWPAEQRNAEYERYAYGTGIRL